MLLDPDEQPLHPRILPEDIVPVMAEDLQRNGNAERFAGAPMELAGRNIATRKGLLEPGKEETLPYLTSRKPGRGRKPLRRLFDVVIHKHVAEVENHGFDCGMFFLHKERDCSTIETKGERETGNAE